MPILQKSNLSAPVIQFIKDVFSVPLLLTTEGVMEIIALIGEYDGPRLLHSNTVLPEVDCLSHVMYDTPGSPTSKKIAVIKVSGPLVRKDTMFSQFFGMTSYEALNKAFNEAIKDSSVDGVVFSLDSPGGQSAGLLDFTDTIYENRGIKPVISLVDVSAFSAAYGIASATDKIYITRDSGIGSIGSILQHVEYSELLEKEGIKVTAIFSGKRKNDFSPYFPLSDEAKKIGKDIVDKHAGEFIDSVARYRGLSSKDVKDTEAGMFFGKDGLKSKLADAILTSPNINIGELVFTKDSTHVGTLEEGGDTTQSGIATEINSTVNTHTIVEKKEVKIMPFDINKFKSENAEGYEAIVSAVKAEMETQFTSERSGLQNIITSLKADNETLGSRMKVLEKNDTIRSHNERKLRGDSIWSKCLASSEVPESMWEKVQGMVNPEKFTKDEIFNEAEFTAAVTSEIADWEAKGVRVSILGSGVQTKEAIDSEALLNQNQKEADKKEAATLLNLAGQPKK